MLNISSTLPQIQTKLASNNVSFKANNNSNLSLKTLMQDTVSFSGTQERNLSDFERFQQNRKKLFTEFRSQMYDGKITKEFAQNLLNRTFPDYPILVKEERGESHEAIKSELTFYKGKPEQIITLNLDKIEEAQAKPERNAKDKPLRGKAIANIATEFQNQALNNSMTFELVDAIAKVTSKAVEKAQKGENLNPVIIADMIMENTAESCQDVLDLHYELDYSTEEEKVRRIVTGVSNLFGEGAGKIVEGIFDTNNPHLTDAQKVLASIDYNAAPDALSSDIASKLTKMLCYSSRRYDSSVLESNKDVKQAFKSIIDAHKEELDQILSMENKAEAREKLFAVNWFSDDNAKEQFNKVIFNQNREQSKTDFTEQYNSDIDAYTEAKRKITLSKTLGLIVNSSKMESHLQSAKLNAEEAFYNGGNKLNADELLPMMYEQLGDYAASLKGRKNIDASYEKYKEYLNS